MHQLQVTTRNRKKRQNVASFSSLLETPATGAVTLPAATRVALRSIAGATAGTTAATIVGTITRTIKTPALAAGEHMVLDWIERAAVVTPASGFELLLDIGLGRFAKISQGA